MDQGGKPGGGRWAHDPATALNASEDAHDRIFEVLTKFMSVSGATAAIAGAKRVSGIDVRLLRPSDTPALFATIEKCAAAFLERKAQAQLHGELQFELSMLTGNAPASALLVSQSLEVRSEWDVNFVRARAREIVAALGGKSYDAVRTMTLVSELARNIVLYTPGGRIDFTPSESPRSLVVYAADEGSGIGNLEEILSGRYRSKTGLGKGLVGAKRLAQRFEIQTSASGTRIEAEVRF
jgi:serine/threonine-protein kinase RsbT